MAIALSLLVLTTIALLGGAFVLFRRGRKQQAWLMLGLAIVMGLNVMIWTWPTENGATLASGAAPG